MHSFLFPEDLDPTTVRTLEHEEPQPKKIRDAVPVATTRRRPVPIFLPPTFRYDAIEYKAKDEVVVSVTRLSLDERSPRLQKVKEKRPSPLARWKSATLTKQDKEDRETRMAEAERSGHATARVDGLKSPSRLYAPLSSLAEESSRDGKHSPMDYGVHAMMF